MITGDALRRRLIAIDIDLRCSLTLSRALMQGLAAVSSHARSALQAALDDEIADIANDDSVTAAATRAIVDEARELLLRDSEAHAHLAHRMERALVDKAARLAEETGFEAEDRGQMQMRRCG